MAKIRENALKKLWNLILLEKSEIFSIYFYSILSGFIQLSLPLGVQAIISFVIGATMVTSVYVLILLVVLGVLIVGIMQINQMRIIEKIQQNIFARNAFLFAEKIPRLDLKEMDQYYLPEKVNRFFDTLNIQKGLSKILLDLPLATIQILFGLILLSLYHPVFIIFGVILILILWLILKLSANKGLETSIEESNHKYSVVAWFEEMARVIKSFKYSEGTHLNLYKTDQRVLNYIIARTAHFKILLIQFKILVFFKVTITASMLIVGTYLLLNQKLNIGEFIAAEIIILTIINAVEKIIISLDSVYDVITGLEKIATIIESPNEQNGTNLLSTTNGIAILMRDVEFYYQSKTPIFKNLSLQIPANTLVSIAGEAGTGKSSLLELLSGNYKDFTGSILFNFNPLQSYQLESLRKVTGVYLDEQDIIEGTVFENIALGRNQITSDHIMQLAIQIGFQPFILSLPNGFETEVDSSGRKLPSSSTKKILLLRALVNNPALILLEEPCQSLAPEEKTSIIKYLVEASKTATIVVATNDKEIHIKSNINIQLQEGQASIS